MAGEIQVKYKEETDFPNEFKSLKDCPQCLYYEGSWSNAFFTNNIGVVGTRHPTSYGENITRIFVKAFVDAGLTVVSGLMYGIDEVAHKTALEHNGKTLAILGSCIPNISRESREVVNKDVEKSNALLITEYNAHHPTTKWTFVKRNRLVAAISKALLVVEATEGSGTLITARHMLSSSKPVFLVAHNINAQNTQGLCVLENMGARTVFSPSVILKELGIQVNTKYNRQKFSNSPQEQLYTLLKQRPLSLSEISVELKTTLSKLYSIITELELNGLIYSKAGVYYAD